MNYLQPGSFEEFEREVREAGGHANVIPVVRTVVANLQTPVDAFSRLAGATTHAFFFESVEGGESLARYSFIGIDPEMIVRGRGHQIIIERAGSREVRETALPDFIREHFSSRKLAGRSGLAPLAGGAVGFLGFQATGWFEPAFAAKERILGDDAVWMFFRTVLAFDRAERKIQIVSVVFADEADGDPCRLKQLYDDAVEATTRIELMLQEPETGETGIGDSFAEKHEINEPAKSVESGNGQTSNWSKAGFEAAVRAVKEHIVAGDCYQVVISQCFRKKVKANPISIYRALRATNPSPYMFFLQLGKEAIFGASPEMLVRCRGRELEYHPIAGTRPRGADDIEDKKFGEELCADEKEVAEHVMLVDLGRNDLGRVAEYGSVTVAELMTVERYSHVQHLVSSLRARLRNGLDRFDALASCFPAGTVTGAPKVRAMEIIQELEPEPRGVYSGGILYADYAENLDSCIAIRTLVMDADGNAYVQAGAGIVADSVPEREYEETVSKARALFRAIEMAEQK